MAPFEALYGRKWRTPLYWSETGESQLFGPKIIKEAEKLHRYSETGVDFQRRGLRVSEGVTYQRFAQVQGQREAVASLHWSVQDLRTERRGGLPTRVTRTVVRRTQCVSYLSVEEMLEGTRGAVATGGTECVGGLDL
jgi:hypothetical protein